MSFINSDANRGFHQVASKPNIIIINNGPKDEKKNEKRTADIFLKEESTDGSSMNITAKVEHGSDHLDQIDSVTVYPRYDPNLNYYTEFWKIYVENEYMISKMKTCIEDIRSTKTKISDVEEAIQVLQQREESMSIAQKKKKKNRRTAVEIEKDFKCPYEKCTKTYGSDVSLNLHIKLKHKGGNKTERLQLAKSILEAEKKGIEAPEKNKLNFPPGYLESLGDTIVEPKKKKKVKDENNSRNELASQSSKLSVPTNLTDIAD